jgi:glycosyltransferase involved in cell wall biosynthesis
MQPGDVPFFSVCIPQHNRTSFIVEVIRWIGRQTFRNVELCISDDRSTDGREDEVIEALRATGLPFVYKTQDVNRRYDGNMRTAIELSRGQYCYLLGNDDRPATEDELEQLHDDIAQHGEIGVAISNFYSLADGSTVRRMRHDGIIGAGPWVAAANYRNFSFVSGIVLHGERARALSTDQWDGSEQYQMYIGSRIIAEGRPLLSITRNAIAKDIQIPGETVNSFRKRPRIEPCPITERKLTLHLLAPLVFAAVEPYVPAERRTAMMEYLVSQALFFTYPYWIFEYRRVQSWRFAVGVCLGMRPRNFDPDRQLGFARGARARLLYGAVTLAGLSIPIPVFDRSKPALHRLAKFGFGALRTRAPASP